MYETNSFSGMKKEQLYNERDTFNSTLRGILSHPNNADCNDQFKLLNWSDPETKKPNQQDIYSFLLLELRKEIKLQDKPTGEESGVVTDEEEREPLNEPSNNEDSEPNVELPLLPKDNIGSVSAFNYFYGYLRLVLPDFKKRLIEETLKNDKELVPKTVQKMLIIMPESCIGVPSLEVQTKIEFTGKFVLAFANRAGNQLRDYKSSLHKLIDHKKHKEYYFVGELATPLLTMYETCTSALGGMTTDQLNDERDAFYSTLRAILNHRDHADCNDQFKLLNWSDPGTKKPNQLDIYKFLLLELRKEIKLQRQNYKTPSRIETDHNAHISSPNTQSLNTFKLLPIGGDNPASMYDEIGKYPMNRRPRGLCLIVNIGNFDKGHRHLLPRRGAEKDAELLAKLFQNLHFDVKVHNDANAQTLKSLFFTMQIADHTDYDAFVCCILTHGKLGVIYTSDGMEVEIITLADFFADKNCPTLKAKPKMFFIEACQKGNPEQEKDSVGNSLPQDGFRGDHSSSKNTASDSASNTENRDNVEEKISIIQEGVPDIIVTDIGQAIEVVASSDQTVSMVEETSPTTFLPMTVLVPGSPDFLMSYSALPGSISYDDTQTGPLYIESLCDCLRTGVEIDRALKTVSATVRENLKQRGEDEGPERFQRPFHLNSRMDRLIYI